jgi:hypothetical protein
MEFKDKAETKVKKVKEENREFKEETEIKVYRAQWVIQEHKVLKVREETKEIMV